jgi:hypothetical protein
VLDLRLTKDEYGPGPQDKYGENELADTARRELFLGLEERSSIRDTILGRQVRAIKAVEADLERDAPGERNRMAFNQAISRADDNSGGMARDWNVSSGVKPKLRSIRDWLRDTNRLLW